MFGLMSQVQASPVLFHESRVAPDAHPSVTGKLIQLGGARAELVESTSTPKWKSRSRSSEPRT